MRCTVLLFAHLREAIGSDRLLIDLPEGATVQVAVDALSQQHEIIRKMDSRIAVAVDEQYRPRHSPLKDGCTIALISPVSGG